MPKFTYTGEDKKGNKVTETVEASDRFAVYEIARTAGHTVSQVDEKGKFSLTSLVDVERINFMLSRVKLDELVLVSRNMSAMLSAGLSLTRALSVIERQTKNPRLKGIVVQVKERINAGDQFHQALADHPKTFSDLYVAMVSAGEESGNLAETLATLAIQMERASSLRKKIKGAMIYPIIVITIMIVIGILMMIYVMPSITATFSKLGTELPTMTVIFMAVSNFVNEYLFLTIGSMIGSVVGFLWFLKTNIGKKIFHYVVVKVPVIGTITKEANAARTARTLASLLGSGVDLIRALQITEQVVQNIYYKRIIIRAAEQVEKGQPLSVTFIEREDLYPVLVGEMIAVGEETGQISKMLGELAVFYETEVEQKTDNISTIIEPLLMVFIGGGVGVFALAMIAPIYSIGDSL
jgi:type IV pilus assembly protein PilC